jgi:hypothetical protein
MVRAASMNHFCSDMLIAPVLLVLLVILFLVNIIVLALSTRVNRFQEFFCEY